MMHTSSMKIESEAIHVGSWSGRVLAKIATSNESLNSTIEHLELQSWHELLSELIRTGGANWNRSVLKHSKTGQVFGTSIKIGNQSLNVICKYDAPRGVFERLRPARGTRNWNRAVALLESDVPTAIPLAYITRRRLGGPSWLITQAIENVVDLERVANGLLWEIEPNRVRHIKQNMTTELARLCNVLRSDGWEHRDFKASNVLVTDWRAMNASARMWLVDLDGLSCNRKTRLGVLGRDSMERAIIRLAASLNDVRSITRADRLRFLKAQKPIIGDWKAQWRFYSRRSADYVTRALQRKKGKLDGYDWVE